MKGWHACGQVQRQWRARVRVFVCRQTGGFCGKGRCSLCIERGVPLGGVRPWASAQRTGNMLLWVCCCYLQAFCWLCGGATGRAHTWSSIENHSCGRYKEEAEERVRATYWLPSQPCCRKPVFWWSLCICSDLLQSAVVMTCSCDGGCQDNYIGCRGWVAMACMYCLLSKQCPATHIGIMLCRSSCCMLCMQANSALKCHKRYMHYFTHFQNHQDSHKKEKEQQ